MKRKFIGSALFFLIIALILIGFFSFLNAKGYLSFLNNFFYTVTTPIQRIFQQSADRLSQGVDFISSIKSLNERNYNLEKENKELLSQLANLNEVKRENEILRNISKLEPIREKKLVLARIIGRNIEYLSRGVLIDKGSQNEIRKDLGVVEKNGIFIGKTNEVSINTSKVILITDPEISISAMSQENRTSGIIRGTQTGEIIMDFVPQNEPIEIGNLIITSGLEANIPPGLVIGKVIDIKKTPAQIFQKIIIEPAIRFDKIEKVFVILP